MVKDYKGHESEFNKEAAPDTRKKLMEKLKPLRELKVSLSHAVVEIQTTRCELEAQGLSVAKNIVFVSTAAWQPLLAASTGSCLISKFSMVIT